MTGAERTYRVGCGREFQKNIHESVKQLLDDQIAELGLGDRYESTEREIRGTKNDTIFTFLGTWRNPQGIKSMEGYDAFWGEEANRFSQNSIDILIPTLRKETSCFFWTWNPEFDHDPVDKMFRGPAGPPPHSIVRRVGWQDNPWFPNVLREAMEHDYASNPDKADHIWGGDYIKAVAGAYFTRELRAARQQGRVGNHVVYDPAFMLRTYWDLGRTDATVIWVVQFTNGQMRCIDYCEGEGQAPGYYMNWLRSSGYEAAECVLPHDGTRTSPDNPISMSYLQQMRAAGFKARVVPNQGPDAAQQRVDAARRVWNRIWIHEDNCRPGLKALTNYHEKIDEKTGARKGPDHDWSSHAADAFGLMCVDFKLPVTKLEPAPRPKFGTMA